MSANKRGKRKEEREEKEMKKKKSELSVDGDVEPTCNSCAIDIGHVTIQKRRSNKLRSKLINSV